MEAGAKSDRLKEFTAPCPADWNRGNEVGNKAHYKVLRGSKTWYIYICHLSNFFLIFAHKRWFKDLNDFFSLKIACQNNTRFCWPYGDTGIVPIHHTDTRVHPVPTMSVLLKGKKNPLGFVIGYFFLYLSLKNSRKILQSISILGEAMRGEASLLYPRFLYRFDKPWAIVKQEWSGAECCPMLWFTLYQTELKRVQIQVL